jgi:DAK2 domain fusion protein YloV
VFPVPDGDTGTNMTLTLHSAVDDIRESQATDVSKIAKFAAHGSLMGARGNSGVILSQIFRGFAKAVQGKAELTAADLAEALEEAANAAYRAVPKPTEGTILTVARASGRSAAAAAAEPEATVVGVMQAAAAGARAAVERTPSQLRILRDAGVVDAGGYGLQIMFEGMLRSVEDAGAASVGLAISGPAQADMELPEGGWGYCTEFLIHGDGLEVDEIREEIAALGNSVLVVGEPDLVKVHVHTDDPSRVVTLASTYGRLDRLNVGDMSTQHQRIKAGAGPPNATAPAPSRANGLGLAVVVAGSGLVEIFRGLGADAIVEGGQSMNPSTQDMLQAVDSLPYQEVILLPNNKNVVMAARQVAGLTQKKVRIVETLSVPQGVAALVAFSPERTVTENLEAMRDAASHVHTIEVTHAVRDTRSNGMRVKKGDVIALIDDKLSHAGTDIGEVVQKALEGIGAHGYELVTVYRGQQATDSEAERLTASIRDTYPRLEVELQSGGQEHYPFILSVE